MRLCVCFASTQFESGTTQTIQATVFLMSVPALVQLVNQNMELAQTKPDLTLRLTSVSPEVGCAASGLHQLWNQTFTATHANVIGHL